MLHVISTHDVIFLSPVFPKDWRNNFLLFMNEKQHQGQHSVLHRPSGSRVGTTGYDNKLGKGQKSDRKKKNSIFTVKSFF